MKLVAAHALWAIPLSLSLAGLTGCVKPSATAVSSAAPSITSFTANPTAVSAGGTASLTGVFANGVGVITPGNIAATSGTAVSVTPSQTTIYTLTVTNSAGDSITQMATVTVSASAPAIASFTASPTTVAAGGSTSLTGVFSNGSGVITPGNLAVTSGTAVKVSPSVTTSYVLTVTSSSGASVTQSVTVTVQGGTATINSKLGKPNRVLMGLGAGNAISDIQAQGIQPDVIDTYLVGVGSSSWIGWNSPSGSYVTDTANSVNAIGAIPMFTLYQMAQNGDGNISGISQSSFMDSYWSQARLMFQLIGSYGKPTLVNLEPDFWGYVELQAPNGDPTKLAAVVSDQPECSSLPNTASGIAACMLQLARTYAPNALVGYPESFWGEIAPQVASFMNEVGAQNGDFIVAQTSDRDAGCYEDPSSDAASVCSGRGSGPFYWDETNQTSPNFTESLTQLSTYQSGLGNNLPIVWWQTPLGVPSSTPGGTDYHYRDDHVDYMLKNASQYGNIGTFGIVFSCGADYQTSITTDGGEFATLLKQYLSSGGAPVN